MNVERREAEIPWFHLSVFAFLLALKGDRIPDRGVTLKIQRETQTRVLKERRLSRLTEHLYEQFFGGGPVSYPFNLHRRALGLFDPLSNSIDAEELY